MYTKLINNTTLGYRNHFGFNKGFGFYTQESHVSLRVTNNSGKNEVTFSSDNIEAIVEMKKLITQFYEPSDSTFSSVPLAGDYEMFTDDEDDWVLEDAKDASMNLKLELLCNI